jgi:hypothetical protein
MKTVRWIAIGLGMFLGVVGLFAVAVRFADGPVGPFPGGALADGPLIEEPVLDWSFARAVPEVELQLLEPARSRTTWILVHEGSAYIPCGLPEFRLWKQWPHQALADGRALLRVEGERHRGGLVRIEDSALRSRLTGELHEKYAASRQFSGEIWFFRLASSSTG